LVNKAILVGRLGRDPETRYTGGGVAVTNFSIATDEQWKDRNGEKQKKTEWHKLVAWSKLAEIIQQYCKKGQMVYVEGRLQTREWQDKEGVKRYSTEIVADTLRMLGGGRGADGDSGDRHETSAGRTASTSNTSQASGPEISDEDIPF
jgi:single-strand DNA-binding protein